MATSDNSDGEKRDPPDRLVGSGEYQIVAIRHCPGVANPGESVVLVREPGNPYDHNAIRVDNLRGEQVGYIKATMAKNLTPRMDGSGRTGVRLEGTVPRRGDKNALPLVINFYASGSSEGQATECAQNLRNELREDQEFRLTPPFSGAATPSPSRVARDGIIKPSAVSVTPKKYVASGRCRLWSKTGACGCLKSRYYFLCHKCHRKINHGDCIVNRGQGSGWTHAECPVHYQLGSATIEAGFNDNIDHGRSTLESNTKRCQTTLHSSLRLKFDEPEVGEDSELQGSHSYKLSRDDCGLPVQNLRNELQEYGEFPLTPRFAGATTPSPSKVARDGIVKPSAVSLTPKKHGSFAHCRLWSTTGACGCLKARYYSLCQKCHRKIHLGDCIVNRGQGSGWMHAECPGHHERGLATIEARFNSNVDYGRSFLKSKRVTKHCQITLSSPLRLEFDELEEGGDSKLPADRSYKSNKNNFGLPVASRRVARRIDFENMGSTGGSTIRAAAHGRCAEDGQVQGSEKVYETMEPECKRGRKVNEVARIADDNKNDMRTDEQRAILSHQPKRGDVVAVNALAGCGKTSTVALLCEKNRNINKVLLYLVYNKQMETEAMQSNKFHEYVEIRTTHAFVLRNFFGVENMGKVAPVGEYKIDDIVDELDLLTYCKHSFKTTPQEGKSAEKKLERRAKTIASYIRKTVEMFQSSADGYVNEDHVYWRAKKGTNLTKRTEWRKQVSIGQYVLWADQFFRLVYTKCTNIKNGNAAGTDLDIPHDGYLKVAQMDKKRFDRECVFVDEAQDMTECQADLFWGRHQRADKVIYLFGDRYQQVYRWRGASHSFRDVVDASNPKFTLTGSFRFGESIAACASCVLKALGGVTLHGRSLDGGRVEEVTEEAGCSTMDRGVVLCRTQNGIFQYLYANAPRRWCHLDGATSRLPARPAQWELDLEFFVKSLKGDDSDGTGEPTFKHKGIVFHTLQEIEEYFDDEGDLKLFRALTLLEFLVSKRKPIVDFYSDLNKSYRGMREGESADAYDGVVITTVHKAKGLEFNCPVHINNDFHFKVIKSAVVNRERHCEEANIIYVAITRAKSCLYLSNEAKNCLQHLSELDHVRVQLPFMDGSKSAKQNVLAVWRDTWESFKDCTDSITSVDDVPYPPEWNSDHFPFALHPAMSVPEQRKQLWGFLRVYHPDKFFPGFRHRIQSEMIQRGVKKNLEQITRKCTEILGSLRGEGED